MTLRQDTTPSGFSVSMRARNSHLAEIEVVHVNDTVQLRTMPRPPRSLALIAAMCGCLPLVAGWLFWFFASPANRDSAAIVGGLIGSLGVILGIALAVAMAVIHYIDARRGPMIVIGPGDTVTLPRHKLTMNRSQIDAIEHVQMRSPDWDGSMYSIVMACSLDGNRPPIDVCQRGSSSVQAAARLAEVLGVPLRECTITAAN